MRKLTKALTDPGGPMRRRHTGGWGGWGNLTWPETTPWGGPHPGPDRTPRHRHTGGWGGWGNLTWPATIPWGGRTPRRRHTGGWGGLGGTTWPSGRWPDGGLAPVAGLRSGARYGFGEGGPEYVSTQGDMAGVARLLKDVRDELRDLRRDNGALPPAFASALGRVLHGLPLPTPRSSQFSGR